MIIMKRYLLLFSIVVPRIALVENVFFKKDETIVDILCPLASKNLGVFKTVKGCAATCSKIATCRSFFYNKHDLFCKGAQGILSTTVECENLPGTVYYQTTDVTTTTTTNTTTTTFPVSQYGNPCITNADCTISAFTCLLGTCTCQAGYRYEPSSGSCVLNCVSYGSTYIEYQNTELAVAFTAEYVGLTLNQCKTYCTNSVTCRGVNYSPVFDDGMCRLKSETDLSAFMSLTDVHYYTRNCA